MYQLLGDVFKGLSGLRFSRVNEHILKTGRKNRGYRVGSRKNSIKSTAMETLLQPVVAETSNRVGFYSLKARHCFHRWTDVLKECFWQFRKNLSLGAQVNVVHVRNSVSCIQRFTYAVKALGVPWEEKV